MASGGHTMQATAGQTESKVSDVPRSALLQEPSSREAETGTPGSVAGTDSRRSALPAGYAETAVRHMDGEDTGAYHVRRERGGGAEDCPGGDAVELVMSAHESSFRRLVQTIMDRITDSQSRISEFDELKHLVLQQSEAISGLKGAPPVWRWWSSPLHSQSHLRAPCTRSGRQRAATTNAVTGAAGEGGERSGRRFAGQGGGGAGSGTGRGAGGRRRRLGWGPVQPGAGRSIGWTGAETGQGAAGHDLAGRSAGTRSLVAGVQRAGAACGCDGRRPMLEPHRIGPRSPDRSFALDVGHHAGASSCSSQGAPRRRALPSSFLSDRTLIPPYAYTPPAGRRWVGRRSATLASPPR